MGPSKERLGTGRKLLLIATTWREYTRVVVRLRRIRLNQIVLELQRVAPNRPLPPLEPRRLGKLVYRILNVGPFRPRCLTMALVLFRLLARQGTRAELVVGLPAEPVDHHAHAWIEVDGHDVGPPPGRIGHEELARYGGSGASG